MPTTSLARAFSEKFSARASQRCLGWRRSQSDDTYTWVSYEEFRSQSGKVAASLRQRLPPDAYVGIMGHNCYEWFIADFACLWAGLCSVPLSETWEPGVLEAVLGQTGVAAVFCTPACYARVASAANSEGSSVALILVTEGAGLPRRAGRVECVGMEELLVSGGSGCATEPCLVERETGMPHTILHTSGTTGRLPKGVVYSDGLWLGNMATYPGTQAGCSHVPRLRACSARPLLTRATLLQVGFSYMPLAFITDRHTVYTALWNGGSVGIVTPQGEGEGGGGGAERIFRDLLLVRPTVLKGVPAFWEQALSRPISRLISADLARPPWISADLACLLEQVAQASRMVQDRALAILGGRTRVLCCGAGAISDEVRTHSEGAGYTRAQTVNLTVSRWLASSEGAGWGRASRCSSSSSMAAPSAATSRATAGC